MDQPLRQALRPTARARPSRTGRSSRQVDDEEHGEEAEQDRGRPRHAPARACRRRTRRGSRIASTSASETVPAKFQCTFSNVTQKTLARKRKLVSAPHATPAPAGAASSSTRVRRDTLRAPLVRERRAVERAGPPARVQLAQRGRDPVDVVGRDDDPGAGLADQLGRGAVRRHDREDRPLGREVLEHLARRARPCRDRRPRGSGAAAPRSRAAARATAGAARTGSARAGRRARASPPTRGRRRGSRRGSAPTTSSSPDSSSAVRNGRGSRLPKNEPACVMPEPIRRGGARARRSRRSRSRSRSSRPRPRGERSRISSAIASETQTIASA